MRRSAVCLLGLMLVLQPAWTWSATGHKIIARLAAARITDPAVRGRILAALDGHSDAECKQPDLADRLACISPWADEIRRTTMRATGNWHFVNIPRAAPAYDAARDCQQTPNGDCVINALVRHRAAALGANQTPKARAEALKFVVHLMSDLHEPLHAVDDNGDMGGNNKMVVWFGEAETPYAHWNLHGVWDNAIIAKSPVLQSAGDTPWDLVYSAALLSRKPVAPAVGFSAARVVEWANESHDVAVKNAYGTLPAPKQGSLDGPEKTDKLFYTLGAEYVEANLPALELQLQRAGERLADVLNQMYGR